MQGIQNIRHHLNLSGNHPSPVAPKVDEEKPSPVRPALKVDEEKPSVMRPAPFTGTEVTPTSGTYPVCVSVEIVSVCM